MNVNIKDRPAYLKSLIDFKDKDVVKVLTGVRRSGKSTILKLFSKYLKETGVDEKNIIFINFESLTYRNKSYQQIYSEIMEVSRRVQGKLYICLDEVQQIPQWELMVNSLRVDVDSDIYIAGSNAYLFSSQLSTYLSGRYVQIEVLPLSFKEFVSFNDFSVNTSNAEKFDLYLKFGGMPILTGDLFKDDTVIYNLLESIFDTVIMKDIITQSNVRDPVILGKVIDFLLYNIGNKVSANKIKNVLMSEMGVNRKTTASTIDCYIKLLENAYVFYPIRRYDIKGKEYLKTQGKYYLVDIGFRTQRLGFRNIDRGHILENIVCLELLRRGYKVSIGKVGEKEVDFIATTATDKIYIQVTETLLGESTRQRELAPLQIIRDNFEKIILTTDNLFKSTNEDGIKIINLIDWLLED